MDLHAFACSLLWFPHQELFLEKEEREEVAALDLDFH